ncbi:uncharacterized protein PGTG_04804 [Puccinia graminis f. sp. tritici CRL 75-36-700-3]|uniref:Uncharacterized protein n=1 Tax=Puccinia graminis f. sp. tritici (strain CRL 75-36-700-3 / race SCCL) TaxID=418459 RepID=E3K446_PUCGT|nr:uncharacterized protein PGTG_04804 [Puccinia graminis f. sp. tritici CRL 75-36-700-3]EFP78848.2 hypothetical protein PGTG_04804 [Puccinia graminis f. sp. tritici CRL 75-36-700-3]
MSPTTPDTQLLIVSRKSGLSNTQCPLIKVHEASAGGVWPARSYNLADQEDSLLGRRGCTVNPGRRGCTTSSTRTIPSWPARSYNLADQEDSLLGQRGCTADQEGFLLVDV